MRKTKRVLIGIGILVLSFVSVISLFLFCEVLGINNTISLRPFSSQLFDFPLPDDTSVISKEEKVGNLNWTGDNCGFIAIMIVSSELSESELKQYYGNVSFKPAKKFYLDLGEDYKHTVQIDVILKENAIHYMRDTYERKQENLTSENKLDKGKKEYIIQIEDSGYSAWLDPRCG